MWLKPLRKVLILEIRQRNLNMRFSNLIKQAQKVLQQNEIGTITVDHIYDTDGKWHGVKWTTSPPAKEQEQTNQSA